MHFKKGINEKAIDEESYYTCSDMKGLKRGKKQSKMKRSSVNKELWTEITVRFQTCSHTLWIYTSNIKEVLQP